MADLRASSKLAKCKHYCRVFFTHLFSHVGLCGLVIGYSIVGAITFKWLESDNEMVQRINFQNQRNQHVNDLWNFTNVLNVLHEDQWKALVSEKVKRFEHDVVQAVKNDGYDGKDQSDKDNNWSFSRSLLYCVTVITTIGYGNMAPKTRNGRAATMFYALMGIPMMLLCLTNIGDLLARSFKFAYHYLCVLFRNPGRQNSQRKLHEQSVKQNKVVVEKTADDSTPGNGCIDEKKNLDGLVTLSPAKTVVVHEANSVVIENVYLSKDVDNEDNHRVPIYMVLILLTSYICGGAAMFCFCEGWSFLDGAYFCFITLSTIGFGDLVPGSNIIDATDGPLKLISCCFYLILGLAIIAMSFNLVQEEVLIKCRNLAQNLGFLTTEKKDEYN